MKTIQNILEEFRADYDSMRDLGDKFERLVARVLTLDSGIAGEFKNVWLWSDWPYRNNEPETGIDIIAEEESTGEWVAIQCRFYSDYESKKILIA